MSGISNESTNTPAIYTCCDDKWTVYYNAPPSLFDITRVIRDGRNNPLPCITNIMRIIIIIIREVTEILVYNNREITDVSNV